MNTNLPMLHLVVVGGVHDGRVIPVVPPFLIGRARECQLRPASVAISSRHCVIEDRGGRLFIQDLGSTNGTFLNDDRLVSDCLLRVGDELCVGPLRFLVASNAPIYLAEEPVTPEESAGGNETIVNGELIAADETIVSDDRMTDDEAARLLLDGDDEVDPEQTSVVAELPTQPMVVLKHATPPKEPPSPSSAAGNILRQMRRSKK